MASVPTIATRSPATAMPFGNVLAAPAGQPPWLLPPKIVLPLSTSPNAATRVQNRSGAISRLTGAKPRRWIAQGPRYSSAAKCSGVG